MTRPATPTHPDQFSIIVERNLDWSELDALGHANNARYFTWFEEARMAYFIDIGIPTDGASGWGPILAHTACQFLAPVTWPAALSLCTRPIKLGRSSVTMEYAIFERSRSADAEEEHFQCVALGTGVVVLVRYEEGEKVTIEGALRKRIEAQLNTEES